MALGRSEQLSYTTIKIIILDQEKKAASGTGFALQLERDGTNIPVLVTNKHVIANADTGLLQFTLAKKSEEGAAPDIGNLHNFQFNADFRSAWTMHPDPDVDLAAMPIAPLLTYKSPSGQTPFVVTFSKEHVATKEDLAQLEVCDDIVMVGYPNGLSDSVNNMPIVRRGITATSPSLDFQGKPWFAIDCACYPGSSGSPVILFDKYGHIDKQGVLQLGRNRLKLIGVLASGPQMTARGEIVVVPIPTSNKVLSVTPLMINLGYCMKATELAFFEDHFFGLVNVQKQAGIEEVVPPSGGTLD